MAIPKMKMPLDMKITAGGGLVFIFALAIVAGLYIRRKYGSV